MSNPFLSFARIITADSPWGTKAKNIEQSSSDQKDTYYQSDSFGITGPGRRIKDPSNNESTSTSNNVVEFVGLKNEGLTCFVVCNTYLYIKLQYI
jgi:hypothetical protein